MGCGLKRVLVREVKKIQVQISGILLENSLKVEHGTTLNTFPLAISLPLMFQR
jgi:hypothetical protein